MLKTRIKMLFMLGISIVIILAITTSSYTVASQTKENLDYVYLSDISYINDKSFA